MILQALILCIFFVSAQFNIDGCGSGPRTPLRNPYVCTPDQLRKAAIAMTLQLQSYISPLNPTALTRFVPGYTPVIANSMNIIHGQCCQSETTIYNYYTSFSHLLYYVFANQVPMSAVISEVEGTVKVYAGETQFLRLVPSQPKFVNQVMFVWKPVYQCNKVPDCNCNLELVRMESRSVDCPFDAPHCTTK